MLSDGQQGAQSLNTEADNSPGPFTAPTISLQKGGGAIRGIGEKFATNPVTGTGSLSVPIALSPGRSGFTPQLALTYDSGSGNGAFGLGWNLSTAAISRKTDKGLPRYNDGDEADEFILSGAQDLVPVLVQSHEQWQRQTLAPRIVAGNTYQIHRYRPRVEGLFSRIERWINLDDASDHFWRSISRDNITSWYGRTAQSRIADPENPVKIFSWLICESYDDKGNLISYGYKAEDSLNIDQTQVHEANRTELSRTANRYLKHIRYAYTAPYFPELNAANPITPTPPEWHFELVLDYGEHDADAPTPLEDNSWPVRNDPFSSYRPGFEVRHYRLCQRVLMFHHFSDEDGVGINCLVRSTDFNYRHEQETDDSRNPIHSVLSSLIQRAYERLPAGGYRMQALPPLEFEYSQAEIHQTIHDLDPGSLENLPQGLDSGQFPNKYQWVDLDGDGLTGILTRQGGGWFYKRNLSPINLQQEQDQSFIKARFAPQEQSQQIPSLAASSSTVQFLDLAGDGQPDVVAFDRPTAGFYERHHGHNWTNFKPFESLPVLDWSDPNLKFIDLTGDGHADILISEQDAFCWHPSLAEAGFGPSETVRQALDEEQGPRLVFDDGSQSIYLADLSGDGLTDCVRIRNGEVCYWPNLGYGYFGAKVTMDNAPCFDTPDQFDQSRVRLADIDGSGGTDILYLGFDGVSIYYNQSGNGWSDVRVLSHFPRVDNLSAVQVVDLLGNGTACLVWSSALPGDHRHTMRYIDLMGGHKPHLMIGSRNNLGAETRVHYAPSTKFYIQDRLDGKPWITRLPFVVHVVERVETFDAVSRNRFVSRYAYHHGYFDGIEREFRGFGMVEQFDTEEFAMLSNSEAFPSGENISESAHIPPVYTKTWFHTGVYLGRHRVSNFFAGLLDVQDTGEYYREPGLTDEQAAQLLLPDTVLPEGLSLEEEREACHALKGAMLRQEVYALDGTDRESIPYTVTEQNFDIRQLQPMDDNRHGVFLTHAREALSYHYERNPADPRISHALTLAVDDFGNVLQSAAIGYGRRIADQTLSTEDQAQQAAMRMTCSEQVYTNTVEEADNYRTPLPCEALNFELSGLELSAEQTRFSFDQMQEAVENASRIPYHRPADNSLQKRILDQVRTLYRGNDLAGSLPFAQLDSLALPFENYQLAFDPEHLQQLFAERVTESMLHEGGYVHFDNDDNWWIPTGRVFLSANAADDAAQELTFARQHFFSARRFQDPFGELSIIEVDTYDLLPVQSIDPLDNIVRVQNNYRLLTPQQITDPNGNRSAVAFDVLGMVAGNAIMGKESQNLGDSLEGFQNQLSQQQIDAFFADPRGPIAAELLGNASSRIIYDSHRFQNLREPVFAVTLTRETHVSDLQDGEQTNIQQQLAYSDGFGRLTQAKGIAEPGIDDSETVENQRWITSGWTIFNNKGKPVKQYEPFFSHSHRFEFGVQVGVSLTLFYDPLGRVVATLHPNHSWEKIDFDPWRQTSWDVNDTVLFDPATDEHVGDYFQRLPNEDYQPSWHALRTDPAHADEADNRWPDEQQRNAETDAANKAAAHADTPGTVYLDSLGRPFLSIADNGADQRYATRTESDIEGAPLRVIDARGNAVMVYQLEAEGPNTAPVIGYDIAGRQLFEHSMDGGNRFMLPDITGQPIRQWDARGHRFRNDYDELRRPLHTFVAGDDLGETELIFQRTVYGESQGEAFNHRGKVFQVFDQAGVVTSVEYDFKGNLREGTRQFTRNYRDAIDWNQNPELEDEIHASQTIYDALNRPTELTTPDNSITHPSYNEAGLLEQMAVQLQGAEADTLFIENIDYNAKGQRERIDYATEDGSNLSTTYDYDPETFRLIRLHTIRHRDQRVLQDLHYAYDPTGNITSIHDNAQQTVFFNNTQVEAHNDYTYDPLYRLLRATGREHAAQHNQQRDATDSDWLIGTPFLNSPEALQRYVQEYVYDPVGNILSMQHSGGEVQRWNRRYQYADNNNRLLATSLPGDEANAFSATYEYDLHGNMTRMPHLPSMQWDFLDQLHSTSRTVVENGGTPQTTFYVYDGSGQRVRKITERQAGTGQTPTRQHERIYLGGYEIYREYENNGQAISLERQTLDVMDEQQRVVQVDTRAIGNDDSPEQSIRFQLGNHLGSVALEIDENANLVSFEEYHPYGTTALRMARSISEGSLKRYRYTGMERDEENGLCYHGARYYACWLGRWTASDPLGLESGINFQSYVRCNPLIYSDPDGKYPTVSVDHNNRTITISMDIFVKKGVNEDKDLATQGAEVWNNISGEHVLTTSINGKEVTYSVNFDLKVYEISPESFNKRRQQSITDSDKKLPIPDGELFFQIADKKTFIKEYTGDGIAEYLSGYANHIFVNINSEKAKDNKEVAAHEIGHSLGVIHNFELKDLNYKRKIEIYRDHLMNPVHDRPGADEVLIVSGLKITSENIINILKYSSIEHINPSDEQLNSVSTSIEQGNLKNKSEKTSSGAIKFEDKNPIIIQASKIEKINDKPRKNNNIFSNTLNHIFNELLVKPVINNLLNTPIHTNGVRRN